MPPPIPLGEFGRRCLDVDDPHAGLVGGEEIDELPAQHLRGVRRIPHEGLRLPQKCSGSVASFIRDGSLIRAGIDVEFFPQRVQRDDRKLGGIRRDPGVLPRSGQSRHEDHLKVHRLARHEVWIELRDRKREGLELLRGDRFLYGDTRAPEWLSERHHWPIDLYLSKWRRRHRVESDDWRPQSCAERAVPAS
ncbi:MAG: hypothetical protein WD066_18815 [Planctomycetaceae bacterium]